MKVTTTKIVLKVLYQECVGYITSQMIFVLVVLMYMMLKTGHIINLNIFVSTYIGGLYQPF